MRKLILVLLLVTVATISLDAQTKKFNLGVAKIEKVIKDKMSKKQMETFLSSYNFILRDTIIRTKGSIIKTWEVDSTKKDLDFEYRYKVVFDGDYVLLSARSKNKFDGPIYQVELTVQNSIETYNMVSECINNSYKIKKTLVNYWIYTKGNMTAIVSYGRTEKSITIIKQK
jgi:hypothetical protein